MKIKLTSILIAVSLIPLNSWAVNPWQYMNEEREQWYFEATIGVEYEPTYAGSDKYVTEPELELSATYLSNAGHRYFISLGEIGAHFQSQDDLVFSTVLEYEEERDDEDDDTLTGFDEIEDTIELQTTLTKQWGDYFGAIALQYDIEDNGKGLVWFLAAGKRIEWSERFDSFIWMDISGADSEHMRTEFGVKPSESQATGLAEYRPGSGLKSATLNIANNYELTENWSIGTQISLEYYFSEASDSPLITDEGDELTAEIGLTLEYSF